MSHIPSEFTKLNPNLENFRSTDSPYIFRNPTLTDPTPTDKSVWIITGPGGTGKDAIMNGLATKAPRTFRRGITSTTRPPRPGEKNGVDYHFLSEKQYLDTEHLERVHFNNFWYGIPQKDWERSFHSNKITIWRVDVSGLESIIEKGYADEVASFFILPDSLEFLLRHTKKRENPTQRMQISKQEIRKAHHADYVVINRKGELNNVIDALLKTHLLKKLANVETTTKSAIV